MGVAKVLSTIRGTPWAWAAAAKLLNVQHRQGRVGDGLAEHRLGVGPEGCLELLLQCSPGETKVNSMPMLLHA